MVARILNLCGVYLGSPEVMMEPNKNNPSGYWENLNIHYLSEAALDELGIKWNQLKRLPDNTVHTKKGRRVIQAMRELIENQFANQPVWGWKEPRTCLLMPLWLKAIREKDIRPVVIWRPMEDMARSLLRIHDMQVKEAAKMIHHNMAVLLRSLPMGYHNIVYNEVLKNPRAEVVKICDYLELQNPPMDDILKFVDPKLNHGGANG